jgi:L,D-transpeptidase ErfK/SrfK
MKTPLRYIIPALLIFLFLACGKKSDISVSFFPVPVDSADLLRSDSLAFYIPITQEVRIRDYFEFMDSLVAAFDTLLPYPLSEHALVRANPWIIDTLENTDYYRRMERGEFVYDQLEMTVLKKGDSLRVPNARYAALLAEEFRATWIDLNIPEYQLRIVQGKDTLWTFPVRVGRNQKRYLKMAGRIADMRTSMGTGSIARINRYPVYKNPVDNRIYEVTRRDDNRVTTCPRIPWLDPELDGRRPGCLIHPTTNPVTLGKAYSNGCIGVREADAWRIYYYAPLGTRVVFRYDLEVLLETGDTLRLRDIYRLEE